LVEKLNDIGIYHGDLHEENILIDDKDRVYFIDFGISSFLSEIHDPIEYIEDLDGRFFGISPDTLTINNIYLLQIKELEWLCSSR